MKYRFQLFLFFSLVFLAVLSEANEEKEKKKVLKRKMLNNDVKKGKWQAPKGKAKTWLEEKSNADFLNKWQPLETEEVKKLGPITNNNFSSAGLCNENYKCETITNGSRAFIDKAVTSTEKTLSPLKIDQIGKFLDHLKNMGQIKFEKRKLDGESLPGAEVKHEGVVARFMEEGGKQIDAKYAAAMVLDAYKYIIMAKKATVVRAMAAQPDGKPLPRRSVCLFPQDADKGQADNFCWGKDAKVDDKDKKTQGKDKKDKVKKKEEKKEEKEEEKEEKEEGGKEKAKTADKSGKDEPKGAIWDVIKSALGFKSKKKADSKPDSKKNKSANGTKDAKDDEDDLEVEDGEPKKANKAKEDKTEGKTGEQAVKKTEKKADDSDSDDTLLALLDDESEDSEKDDLTDVDDSDKDKEKKKTPQKGSEKPKAAEKAGPKPASKVDDKKKSKRNILNEADPAQQVIWGRDAEPEPAQFGAAPMGSLYGRADTMAMGVLPRSPRYHALKRRRELLRRRALVQRAVENEERLLAARAQMIREPLMRREAEPQPEPEPEPVAEPEADVEDEQQQGSYLLSRDFFQDIESLIARQSPEFQEQAEVLLERELGFDDCEECFDW